MTDPTPAPVVATVTVGTLDFKVLEYDPAVAAAAFGLAPGRPRIGDTVDLAPTGDPSEDGGLMSWTCPRCGELITVHGDLVDRGGTVGFTIGPDGEADLERHYLAHPIPKETRP